MIKFYLFFTIAFVSQTQSSTEDLDEVDRLANHPVLRANTHDEWLLQHRSSSSHVFTIPEYMFRSSHISFLVFGYFCRQSYENTKYYVIFVYILQGKMGKTEKRKENHATKMTKKPKTKIRKYGMNETDL